MAGLQVEPYSDEVMAASKIVGAAKVKLATAQASAARDWHVLNALENSDEHMQLNVGCLACQWLVLFGC
jgi:hypothetical protein